MSSNTSRWPSILGQDWEGYVDERVRQADAKNMDGHYISITGVYPWINAQIFSIGHRTANLLMALLSASQHL